MTLVHGFMGAEHVGTQVPGSLRAYVTAGKGFFARVLISKKEILKKGRLSHVERGAHLRGNGHFPWALVEG